MKQNKRKLIITASLFLIFIIYTYALTWFDLGAIGPRNSVVAFKTMNQLIHQLLGVNWFLYYLTDWASIPVIFVAFIFALVGLGQLISRKSLFKVDVQIISLGAFYLVLLGTYLFFEFNIINYRPVLINGFLEASYPSSTTMLVICMMLSALPRIDYLVTNKRIKKVIKYFFIIYTVFMVSGRLLSGVHWVSDIMGGILISVALLMLDRLINQKNRI